MSRRIVDVRCDACRKLARAHVTEGPEQVAVFEYHRAHPPVNRRQRLALDELAPPVARIVPAPLPRPVLCRCHACGRTLAVQVGDLLAAVAGYRSDGRRRTIRASESLSE